MTIFLIVLGIAVLVLVELALLLGMVVCGIAIFDHDNWPDLVAKRSLLKSVSMLIAFCLLLTAAIEVGEAMSSDNGVHSWIGGNGPATQCHFEARTMARSGTPYNVTVCQ